MANELSGEGGLTTFMKVMTDEQMEILREQIAVYATICEELVEMHRSLTAKSDLAGPRFGNPYADPLITSCNSHSIGGRQRWSPTPKQLQILERIFNQGISSPGKLKVPEITAELLQHGQVTETNVYNWFQNRRARSKRKQQPATVHNTNAESEVETEEVLSNDKKMMMTHDLQTADLSSSRADEDVCFKNSLSSNSGILYHVDPSIGKPENELFQEEAGNDGFEQMDFYGSAMQQNPIMDHLIGTTDVRGSRDSYSQQDGDYATNG